MYFYITKKTKKITARQLYIKSIRTTSTNKNRKTNLNKKYNKCYLGRCVSEEYYHIKRYQPMVKESKITYIEPSFHFINDRKNNKRYCIWFWKKNSIGTRQHHSIFIRFW